MAIATAFLALLFVLPSAYAVSYTVGDASGWTQGVDYSTWASGKTFAVGDSLVFNYGGSHALDVVNKADYDNCASSNALQSHNDGNTVIPLTQAGSTYFLCPTLGHCSGGMKLAITVSTASNTPSGASPTPPSTTTPSQPSNTPPPSNGASSNLFNINYLVLGACTIFAPLLALMG